MNKKKLFVLLPAAMLALTGCGNEESSSKTTESIASTQVSTTETTTKTDTEVAQKVTIATVEHGKVSASKMEALPGEEIILTIEVDEGYHFVDLKVNGESVEVKENKASVTMAKGGLNVTLEVAIDTFNVTIEETTNGTVTASKAEASAGEEIIFTIAPNDDYEIDTFKVNNEVVEVKDNKATVNMVKGGLNVVATFRQIVYSITINPSEHGKVEASLSEATSGTEVSLTITPDADYHVNEVKINGELTEKTTFTMPKGNVVIEASFAANEYNVTINPSEHGKVEANLVMASVGSDIELKVTPDADYELDTLTVNGEAVSVTENKATVKMVSGGINVSSSFKAIKHKVTINQGEHGTISVDKSEAVTGEEVTFTVTPETGWYIETFKVNDEVVELVDNKAKVAMEIDGLVATATFTDSIIVKEYTPDLKAKIEASDNIKLKLANDIEINEIFALAKIKTDINLNGFNLTTTYPTLISIGEAPVAGSERKSVEIYDGSIISNATPAEQRNLFNVPEAKLLDLANVDITTANEYYGNAAAIHCSDATNVALSRVNLDFKGVYGISTNNTEGKDGSIRVADSKINVTSANFDNTAFVGNTEGINVEITNSTFTADRQALIARTGTWKVENSTFMLTSKWLGVASNKTTDDSYLTGTWRSGNEVPSASVVIGDNVAGSYNDNVSFTTKNCKADKVVARSEGIYKTSINIDPITYLNSYKNLDIDEETSKNVTYSNLLEKSIAEMNALTSDDAKNMYMVTGYLKDITNVQFGNGTLVDEDGNELMIYGSYTKGSYSLVNGNYTMNKTDRVATTKDYIGKKVTLLGVFKNYGGTKEIVDAIVINSEIVAATATISVTNPTCGTASLSKTSDIFFGDEIEVIATPNEGYEVKSVIVTNANGTAKDITASMKFNATTVNNVVVEFAKKGEVVAKTYTVAFNATNNKKSVSSYTSTWENVSEGVSYQVACMNNNKNDWNYVRAGIKGGPSVASIYTTKAFELGIKKTSITLDKYNRSLVNSFKLLIADNAKFENAETIDLTSKGAAGTIETVIETPKKNCFYKYEFNLKKGSGNGFVQISALTFEETL